MSVNTEHYMLEAFIDGDVYSALADKRRFSVIDNQLNAMTTVIGDGRISGWEIQNLTFPNVRVTKGTGFIDGYYVATFNDQDFELSASTAFNFYAQRRVGITGTIGPYSDVATVTYTDTSVPATPIGFTANSSIEDPYFTILLEWTANTEIDLDHYDIERSLSPTSDFELIDAVSGTSTSYEDTVDEDLTYYYRFYAVDESGYRSIAATDSATTLLSPNLPPNPWEVFISSSEGAINILWKRPLAIPFAEVDHWEISWVRLESDGSEINLTRRTTTVDRLEYLYRIDDLMNGETYRITAQTVDNKGRKSDGFVSDAIPQISAAPKDPTAISVIETEEASESDWVVLNFSWTDGTDEYDPLIPYRYNIYTTIDGLQESLAYKVTIGDIDQQIEVYTFDLVTYHRIPQDTLITFRFTSISEDGKESAGSFIRFRTTLYGAALPISNLDAEFDDDRGKIVVTWNNRSDTADLNVQVLDDDRGDEYDEIEIFNDRIGLIDFFEFDGDHNHVYTILVTPYNNRGTAGSTDSTGLSTVAVVYPSPALPKDIFVRAGDRQLSFSWIPPAHNISVRYYRIYKKIGSITTVAADWTLLDTVPRSIQHFNDYGLENDQVYSYYITSLDLYNNESLHLPDGAVNLNFVEGIPKASGILTEPENVQASLIGNDIFLTWEALLEEFDAYSIYRSVGSRHSWEVIATLDRNTTSYTDEDIPLVDGTIFYYCITKAINDSDIVIQISNVAPESSIFLGHLTLGVAAFGDLDIVDRRDILDLVDPIGEYTDTYLLTHKHRGTQRYDPERVDLEPELIITDWETLDGRIFTTDETDISGTGYVVKIDGRFPSVLFSIDADTRRLVFTEPIVSVNDAGEIIEDLPSIEVRVLGVSEVNEMLDASRFDHIHARQVAYGRLMKEQTPSINHEGRIREQVLPKTFMLERYSDHTFILPQGNIDNTKNFGDGTTFYCVIESDGLIDEILDFDQEDNGAIVGFRKPSFSTATVMNLKQVLDIAEVTEERAFQSEKSYYFAFEFEDASPERWIRVTTFDAVNEPNPVIDLKKRLRFKILNENYSIYLALGVREIEADGPDPGSNGGTVGPIEWVGVTDVLTDDEGQLIPIGKLVSPSSDWQEIEFDLENESIHAYTDDADGVLSTVYGVLEHLAFTVYPDQTNPTGPFHIYIDKVEQVDDVLAAGTSQGIMISRDFGTSWATTRYVESPVHKFYRAQNNSFIWAIAANKVLLAVDPAYWFETTGLTGVQFIRDIVEDDDGNMFVSTEKGVYWFEIALINTYSVWRQTQPITAYTTDCYGLYHHRISSGIDEIWVSTEIGIFKTGDHGQTWVDSNMDTEGLPAYQFIDIGTSELPNVIGITRKHVVRKLGAETNFTVLANFEVQFNVFDIWLMEYFADRLYVSTGSGVYSNSVDELFVSSITTAFERVFPGLDIQGHVGVAFGLDTVVVQEGVEQLFIGQENRLMMANEDGVLSIKEQFPNKELPSFFADDTELNIGYVYNAFNNVLCFRQAQPVNTIYRASYIPRKFFIPINGGWAQTNPSTDVFIYVNGVPKWLDFRLDEAEILSQLQLLQGKLGTMEGTLNDFNSLHPEASNMLETVLSDIAAILSGGDGGASQVTNQTIITFLDDYTRFLAWITNDVVITNELDVFPTINISGFVASQREAGSRAALLEERESFVANDATGISIDTYTGEIDFLTVYTTTTNLEDRLEYVFDKYDNILIYIFNSNISSTGEYTHRELEDQMEAVNTGLSSGLSQVRCTNMIKTGIFLEQTHNSLFDNYQASNVQSKYYAAHTNDWYDIPNSTVDYDLIVSVDNHVESRFCNVLSENPYLSDRIWVGTDNDIMQYEFDTILGELTTETLLRPGNGISPMFIWDSFILSDDDIYVVAEEQDAKVGHIYSTIDGGITWTDLETINLPQQIYAFRIMSGTKVAATENGIYYCDNSFGTWYPANLSLSPQLSNDSPSVTAFSGRIRNLTKDIFLIAESDRWFYTSGSGLDWYALSGQFTTNNVTVVNKVVRFKSLTWVATDRGLYNDGNSILSDRVSFGLQTQLEATSDASVQVQINDIDYGEDALYCCSSAGKIYRFLDNEWLNYEMDDMEGIHKINLYETNVEHYLLVVAHNKIEVVNVTPGVGVFDS